jgi:hypothetical protein
MSICLSQGGSPHGKFEGLRILYSILYSILYTGPRATASARAHRSWCAATACGECVLRTAYCVLRTARPRPSVRHASGCAPDAQGGACYLLYRLCACLRLYVLVVLSYGRVGGWEGQLFKKIKKRLEDGVGLETKRP